MMNESGDASGQQDARRAVVLLVEDDAAVRRSLQLLLRGCSYNVRAYASGRQMLADPAAQQAACLITDYRKEDMNGIEILRHLKTRGWHSLSILITAHHAPALASAAREVGFDHVLEKPLQDRSLVVAIGQRLRPH